MKSFLPCFIFILFNQFFVFSQSYNWSHSFGDSEWDEGRSISTDNHGNVYVVGHFKGTVDFNPGAGNNNLTAVQNDDAFVLKLNAEGDLLWAVHFGDSAYIECNDIATDDMGNVYITGSFLGKTDFDPGAGVYEQTSSYMDRDIFVQKLDTDGNFIWSKQISGISPTMMSNPSPCNAYSMALDGHSNIYLTGYFDGQVDFNPSPLDTFLLNVVSQSDIFVCKLDTDGEFVWAQQIGGTQGGVGYAIAVDENSSIYTTGTIGATGIFDFDPGVGTYNLSSSDQFLSEIFISKLDSLGNFVWAKVMGPGEGSSIVTNDEGYSYSTASFPSSVIPVVHKLSPSGAAVWTKELGGLYGKSLALDTHENLYLTGICNSGTHDYDPGPGTFNLTAGLNDTYMSKLDSSGAFIWAGMFEAQNQVFVNEITVDNANNIFTTGYFDQSIDCDPSTATSTLTSLGSYDAFVCSFTESFSGLPNESFMQSMKAYPNPTDGHFTIELNEQMLIKEVVCYHVSGKKVPVQYSMDGSLMHFQLNQPAGLYLLKFENESGQQTYVKVHKL